jgi:hypothetical protein
MAMNTTHGEMHGEHRQWSSDNAMWCDDLDCWKWEAERAIVALKDVERFLRDHVAQLDARRSSIGAEGQRLRAHERALAEFEAGGQDAELMRLARPHLERSADHARERIAHEGLKKRHHEAMAYWTLLVKSLARSCQAKAARAGNETLLVT